ncbi:MAG: metal ABC transporter substrate-binding protein [Candidatus Saccharicenans sp.]|nr:metal ABC transporter substrate-binding protein [Candidatus Saccharicenans sp.]
MNPAFRRPLSSLINLILILTALLFPASGAAAKEKLTIVTTILPLSDLAREIADTRASVVQLIPPSAEIHHFQLTPSDVKVLLKADLLLAVGGGLEPWLERLEKSAIDREKTRILKFFDLLENSGYPGLRKGDPHIWLDLQADKLLVEKIVAELSSLDPEGISFYRARGEKLAEKIAGLDRRFREELASCQQQTVVVAGHDAFGYMADRYNLRIMSLSGPHPEAQPGARKLQQIIKFIRERKIRVIFYESSQPPVYAKTIARETGASLVALSAGVNLTSAQMAAKKNFLELMSDNLTALKEALDCH